MKRKYKTFNMQQNEESEDKKCQQEDEMYQEEELMSFSHMTSVIWRIDLHSVIHPFIVIDTPTT